MSTTEGNVTGEPTLPKPNVKDSRVMTYLNLYQTKDEYVNTKEEDSLVYAWRTKFVLAEKEYQQSRNGPEKVAKWRKAWEGIFNKLNDKGEETTERMKALRKVAFEIVEQKINARIPAPKMSPRFHADIVPVNATERLIMHEMTKMMPAETHDEAEHGTLIDAMGWFKVSWDPFQNTHERSGMPIVEWCPVDTVFPQPGVTNWRKLEYIFERSKLTVAQVKDLYDRDVFYPNSNDLVEVITVWYLNEDRHVGKFAWCEPNLKVLCNDLEWGMRRRRECMACHEVVNIDAKCPVCGSTDLKYVGVKQYKLDKPLDFITNPYRSAQSPDEEDDEEIAQPDQQLPEGTVIPHYLIRQLPFVPRRNIKIPKNMYSVSEVELLFENQDTINKFLNKAERKSSKSKAYVTKMKDSQISDDGSQEITYIEVESPQEANTIKVTQVTADITEEITMGQVLYDNVKSTAGVTDTDQGKNDPSARSGKAKQMQIAASNQRKQGPNVMREAAYAGVYELIFKNLLAYSDEERSFVSLLPDGTPREEVWSKYMFLAQDKNGDLYYRDDFAWSVDEATEITQDRASMWQLIDNDYINGTMGNEVDPIRALQMYWTMKDQAGYPTARFALNFLNDTIKKLPTQIEQALVNNPEAVQLALSFIADMQKASGLGGGGQGQGQGGERPGSGSKGNNSTQGANVEKTNNKNRSQQAPGSGQSPESMTGGLPQ